MSQPAPVSVYVSDSPLSASFPAPAAYLPIPEASNYGHVLSPYGLPSTDLVVLRFKDNEL